MIEYIKGEVTDLTPAYATVEAHGVGYGLNISLNTYDAIRGQRVATLYVYEAIREDAYTLYGFATKRERDLFILLISVNGVGSGTARMMLSSMTIDELCSAISMGDERVMKSIKGIGLKTAQRIIIDLADKIISLGITAEVPRGGAVVAPVNSEVKAEAVAALTMLGFAPAPTQKVVNDILTKNPDMPVEQVIKTALKQIK